MKLMNKSTEYFLNDFNDALLFNKKMKKTS